MLAASTARCGGTRRGSGNTALGRQGEARLVRMKREHVAAPQRGGPSSTRPTVA